MAKDRCGRCPGCGKHCELTSPRCKYGRAYTAQCCAGKDGKKAPRWAAYAPEGGLAWRLLDLSRRLKRSLRKARCTEPQLLAALTPQELALLDAIFTKLDRIVPEGKE